MNQYAKPDLEIVFLRESLLTQRASILPALHGAKRRSDLAFLNTSNFLPNCNSDKVTTVAAMVRTSPTNSAFTSHWQRLTYSCTQTQSYWLQRTQRRAAEEFEDMDVRDLSEGMAGEMGVWGKEGCSISSTVTLFMSASFDDLILPNQEACPSMAGSRAQLGVSFCGEIIA